MSESIDYVQQAVDCFIAVDSCPTDPVKALAAHFEANASEELKARAAAEGKTAATCWKFIEAVARKALKGRSGHIEPTVVYAVAMHYFQDVPADWDKAPEPAKAETPAKPVKKAPKKPKEKQGFFFDLMETPVVGGEEAGDAE